MINFAHFKRYIFRSRVHIYDKPSQSCRTFTRNRTFSSLTFLIHYFALQVNRQTVKSVPFLLVLPAMTRRSKSNKCGAFFTYHERNNIQHGTERRRLPGGAMKEWHQCSISLSTPKDAVLTPEGILYDREAIVKALLSQKQFARMQHELDVKREQLQLQEEGRKERARIASDARRDERNRDQISLSGSLMAGQNLTADGETTPNAQQNFWMPGAEAPGNPTSQTHTQGRKDDVLAILAPKMKRRKENKIGRKAVLKTKCPVTDKPLRMRDLISLTLQQDKRHRKNIVETRTEKEESSDESEGSGGGSGQRAKKESEPSNDYQKRTFVCPVCHIVLTNAAKPVALRTGTVLCTRCVDNFVRKDGADPCTSQTVTIPGDIIVINNCGTAFAGSVPDNPGSKEASLYRPSVT